MGGGSTPGNSPIDAWREELEMNAAARSQAGEGQKSKNAKVNRDAVLDVLPVISNVRSAGNALESGEDFITASHYGHGKKALKSAGLFSLDTLGAVSGLPFSKLARQAAKGADSRAGVFMVAPDSKKSEKAFQMRDEGASNEQVAKETRRHFGPEGKLRVEADDWNVPVNTRKIGIRHGEVVPMRQVFPHHSLFSHNPDLGELPVKFRQPYNAGDVAYMSDKGYPVMPLGKGEAWDREQLSKVLQYNLSRKHGFADAITHDMEGALGKYQEAVKRVQDVIDNPRPGDDLEAALRWRDHIEPLGVRLEEAAVSKNNSTGNRISKRIAGNAEARAVRERSYGNANKVYPYQKEQWKGLYTIPRQELSREELTEFLKNWRTYGVGRDLFGGL